MASFVYYKFRSQKDGSRIEFEGTGISVFELKRRILLAKNLSRSNDLALYDQHNQEYQDDTFIIPRCSSVIASRLPASQSSRGQDAQARYTAVPFPRPASSSIASKPSSGAISSRPSLLEVSKCSAARSTGGSACAPHSEAHDTFKTSPPLAVVGSEEGASIAAMFDATEHQWEETQERMSLATRVPTTSKQGSGAREANVRDSQGPQLEHTPRPTPPRYICYRCGQRGHWIQHCPTNNDRSFDNKPRIKRATGIPRRFLKKVDQPTAGYSSVGVMMTSEGGYVVAQPDAASWQKQTARPRILVEADIRSDPPSDASLACPLCSSLFRDAVETPCCDAVYCEECIQTHLLEYDFECPACHSGISSLDKLIPKEDARIRVQAHIDKELAESRVSASSSGDQIQVPPTTVLQAADNETTDETRREELGPAQRHQQFSEPAGIQAQIDQVYNMMKNPTLSPEAQEKLRVQIPRLTSLRERARLTYKVAEDALTIAPHGMNVPQLNMDMDMKGMDSGMGGYSHNNMLQPAWNFNMLRTHWTNPFPNQPPAGPDSPYERLPVNNHRRGRKRNRPCDILEIVGTGPANKVARYWE